MNNIKLAEETMGQRIKAQRIRLGITQEQLAELVEIGTPNISYIENGKFYPTVETLEKICKALNVKPFELYMFDSEKSILEMKSEMINELDKNEKLLKQMYKIFLALK